MGVTNACLLFCFLAFISVCCVLNCRHYSSSVMCGTSFCCGGDELGRLPTDRRTTGGFCARSRVSKRLRSLWTVLYVIPGKNELFVLSWRCFFVVSRTDDSNSMPVGLATALACVRLVSFQIEHAARSLLGVLFCLGFVRCGHFYSICCFVMVFYSFSSFFPK